MDRVDHPLCIREIVGRYEPGVGRHYRELAVVRDDDELVARRAEEAEDEGEEQNRDKETPH